MKKRIAALLILAVMLLAAAPALGIERNVQLEDFTVDAAENGVTVTLPAGYADSGFFKLFWKNGETGEIRSEVFPVDTPACLIETGDGAEYSFQLFYAKKRGLLPASWKEEPAPAAQGPVIWKVLWVDVETIDCQGIINHLSEANHRESEETARAFEALAEELTGGLVDIQVTRMTLEEPFTSLIYDGNSGYIPDFSEMKHYAMRKYDSVFLCARMDRIHHIYAGITTKAENSKEEPGYSMLAMVGDHFYESTGRKPENTCVHEWIHQLGFFYENWQLDIPNPDEPHKYGYDAAAGLDDPLFFRDVLTMKARPEDGRLTGVPAEAWQYKPTHTPEKWNLSYMQEPKAPSLPDAQPAVEPAEYYGTIDGFRYKNTDIGLICDLKNWYLYLPDSFPYWIALQDNPEAKIHMFASSQEQPQSLMLIRQPSAAAQVNELGETGFIQSLETELLQQETAGTIENLRIAPFEFRSGSRTIPGLEYHFTLRTVDTHIIQLFFFEEDAVYRLLIESYMSDTNDSILERLSLADR